MVERVAEFEFSMSVREHAARTIRARVSLNPRVAIVLGSGLGGFAEDFEDAVTVFPIETFPVSFVDRAGTVGSLVVGKVDGFRSWPCRAGFTTTKVIRSRKSLSLSGRSSCWESRR